MATVHGTFNTDSLPDYLHSEDTNYKCNELTTKFDGVEASPASCLQLFWKCLHVQYKHSNQVLTLHSISSSYNTYIHTPFNGPLSRTTRVSRYQKGTNLDFTEARDSEWQWHQLGQMQVCTSLQTDNHGSTPPLSFFYRPDALPAAQPTASKH